MPGHCRCRGPCSIRQGTFAESPLTPVELRNLQSGAPRPDLLLPSPLLHFSLVALPVTAIVVVIVILVLRIITTMIIVVLIAVCLRGSCATVDARPVFGVRVRPNGFQGPEIRVVRQASESPRSEYILYHIIYNIHTYVHYIYIYMCIYRGIGR